VDGWVIEDDSIDNAAGVEVVHELCGSTPRVSETLVGPW
jgi:hypothetical protein